MKGLVANGVDPYVISSDADDLRLLKSGVRSVNLRGCQDHSRPTPAKVVNLMRYYASLVLYLFKHRKGVVHFTGIFRNELILGDGFLLSLCFRILSSRFIYTVHNVLPHSKENNQFFKWIYRLIYKLPDTLLVHTRLAKKQLMDQFSVPEKKIIVISIGLNEEIPITGLNREEARKHFGFGIEDRVILFFGKGDKYKGLDVLIEAFNRLDLISTKLLISGWFPNFSYRQQIVSALSASCRKKDILLFEQFIPNDEVEVFFKSADVLALPYRNVYQSGVIFLCFSFGLPLVATEVGSIREFVEDDMGIISRENDPQGLADAFRSFFETQDRFEREKIATKAQKFKWEKICQTIVSIYK